MTYNILLHLRYGAPRRAMYFADDHVLVHTDIGGPRRFQSRIRGTIENHPKRVPDFEVFAL
jgi:hypothetical protein